MKNILSDNKDAKQKKLKVLTLDDDLTIRRVLEDLLGKDYDYKNAADYREFKGVISEFNPDVLLLDLLLPDGDGIEICKELRNDKKFEKLHILILTGTNKKEIVERGYSAGADDYIRKPIVPYEIKSKIAIIERNIRHQDKLIFASRYYSGFNKKLYNLHRIIQESSGIRDRIELLKIAAEFNRVLPICYLEIVVDDNDSFKPVVIKNFDGSKEYVSFKQLGNKLNSPGNDGKKIRTIKLAASGKKKIDCCISPIFCMQSIYGYIVFQRDSLFEKDDKEIISLYSDFISIMLDRLEAQEALSRQCRIYREEIGRVRKIQLALLPRFDDIKGYDIATSYLTADDLSGDFFDVFYLDENIYQIILCDISGHGAASSYIGNQFRTLFRIISTKGLSPASVIRDVNNTLVKDISELDYYGTVIICQIDLNTGKVILALGGHPPAFYYNGEKGAIEMIYPVGPIVGQFKDSIYGDVEILLKKGDSLLLYTDGLIESFSEDREIIYGEERLMKCFHEKIDLSSMDIIHSIIGSVYEFTGYSKQDDDITMICIKRV